MLLYKIYRLVFYRNHQIKRLKSGKYNCPCCGYMTLFEKGGYEICPVCYWEDESLGEGEVSGANGMTIVQGRKNFIEFGVCDKEMVSNILPKNIVEKFGRK